MNAMDAVDTYADVLNGMNGGMDADMAFGDGYDNDDIEGGGYVAKASRVIGGSSPSDFIIDIREYDIAYYLRVAIDKGEAATGCVVTNADVPAQIFESGCGTRSRQTTARSTSHAFENVWSVLTQSSWHLISKRPRRP